MEEMENAKGANILSGEASAEEIRLHELRLVEDPSYKLDWEEMESAWELGRFAVCHDSVDVADAYQKVRKQLDVNQRSGFRVPIKYRYAVVAALAGIILLAGLFRLFLPSDSVSYQELVIHNSLKDEVVLSDGSLIFLNYESKLVCMQPFSDNERRVRFSGEGFFNVISNEKQPFVIETMDLEVRVVGTSFNVRTYEGSEDLSVDVISGMVEIKLKESDEEVLQLTAGDGLTYNKAMGKMVKQRSKPNVIAWKTGDIRFQDAPMSEVIQTIERVYRVPVRVNDSTILDEKLVASFSQNSLSYILNVVCLTFNLQQDEVNGVILLSRKPI
jgi:transmembrane sensor